MHSSPSASPPSSFLSVSLSSLAQSIFLAGIAYFLAGAPLSAVENPSVSSSTRASRAAEQTIDVTKLESLVIPETNLSCSEHAYKGVYVLSREPLVVYIEGFLAGAEAEELVRASEPLFKPSTVWTKGKESLDTTIRRSEKAQLPRDLKTTRCVEQRAREFQGYRKDTYVEKMWSQRYSVSGHYGYHYDWSSATKTSGRISSFMVYLEANCTGGGTHFPRLQRPSGQEWCRFIECDYDEAMNVEPQSKEALLKEGIIFKPIAGNAVFWENMRSDGTGYLESWHAGLPVNSGVKIGLNIWSWFQAS